MSDTAGYEKVKVSGEHGGRLVRVRLAAPKANILDSTMMRELGEAVRQAAASPEVSAIVIEGEGSHFSFGASVEEHTPQHVGEMLPGFHRMFRELAAPEVPLVAAVRGQCLGGGFELALFCDFLLIEEGAHLGVPEIKLGVFPPVACALLPYRLGGVRVSELVLTGVTWNAARAAETGLANRLFPAGELEAGLQEWLDKQVLGLSSASLRLATRALRLPWLARFFADLQELERIYLEELVPTPDASEGILAFMEKRKPVWTHGRVP